MDVYVNNAPFAGDRATEGTLGQLIEQLTAEDSDRLIVELRLNDQVIGDDRLQEVLALPLADTGRVDLEIDSARSLSAQALGHAANMLEANRAHYVTIAEQIAMGNSSAAMELLNECFTVWNTAEQSLARASQAIGLDLNAAVGEAPPPAEMIEALRVQLDEIRKSLEARDFVAIADQVEYDMADVTDGWQRTLVSVQQSLLR